MSENAINLQTIASLQMVEALKRESVNIAKMVEAIGKEEASLAGMTLSLEKQSQTLIALQKLISHLNQGISALIDTLNIQTKIIASQMQIFKTKDKSGVPRSGPLSQNVQRKALGLPTAGPGASVDPLMNQFGFLLAKMTDQAVAYQTATNNNIVNTQKLAAAQAAAAKAAQNSTSQVVKQIPQVQSRGQKVKAFIGGVMNARSSLLKWANSQKETFIGSQKKGAGMAVFKKALADDLKHFIDPDLAKARDTRRAKVKSGVSEAWGKIPGVQLRRRAKGYQTTAGTATQGGARRRARFAKGALSAAKAVNPFYYLTNSLKGTMKATRKVGKALGGALGGAAKMAGPMMMASIAAEPLMAFLNGFLAPLSILSDVMGGMGAKLSVVLVPLVLKLVEILFALMPLIDVLMTALMPIIDVVIMIIDPLIAILGWLMPLFDMLEPMGKYIAAMLEPIGLLMQLISGQINFSEFISGLGNTFRSIVVNMFDMFGDAFSGIIGMIFGRDSALFNSVTDFFAGALDKVGEWWEDSKINWNNWGDKD